MAEQESWKELSKAAGSASLPRAVTVIGDHIRLVPLCLEDADDIFRLTHAGERDDIWAEMKVGPFDGVQSFRAHVSDLLDDAAHRSRGACRLALPDGGEAGAQGD